MDILKQKYKKYKEKYVNLKKRYSQTGGSKDINLESTTANFIDSLEQSNSPPIYTLDVNMARKVLESVATPDNKIYANMEDTTMDNVSVRIIRPPKLASVKIPVVLYVHGGGWILGNKNTHDRIIKQISIGAMVAVVFVNYTPAPEAQYPTQINQIYNVLKYIGNNADKHNFDKNNIIIMGDSVGGNMATAVALMAKDNAQIKLKYQILAYPVTNADMNTESFVKYKDGPWLSKKAMEWYWDTILSRS